MAAVSADNWARCPRCTDRAAAEAQRKIDEVAALYGKASAEEYEAARRNVVGVEEARRRVAPTFREDYSFSGAEDGVICADYGGSCRECGLEIAFTHQVEFYPAPEAKS